MADRRLLDAAIASLGGNDQQRAAVLERAHCVVLAGPGSGKTKTLTIAMARALVEDVQEPRGIACITYNNECAGELQSRLSQLGVESNERVFVGTVHSFALTQIILPYARCVMPELPASLRVATDAERQAAVENAYSQVISTDGDPHDRWRYAEEKRRRSVDRTLPAWRERNPELADFIEAYEVELHSRGLIDFDDMPLLGLRIVREHGWVRRSLQAKFPVLFVDEYQDLGHGLHELVQLLCFGAGLRLFAVGDPDQSIYRFQGANPNLLARLATQPAVRAIRLRFNYRSGSSIIDASMAALGEERDYEEAPGAAEGRIEFHSVGGDLHNQARTLFDVILPKVLDEGTPLDAVAVLYRWGKHGDPVAAAARSRDIPIVRADNNALVKRSSPMARFIESCAAWVSGGWRVADPRFYRLTKEAAAIVLGPGASEAERLQIQDELIGFLHPTIGQVLSAHAWLIEFRRVLLPGWRARARAVIEEWGVVDQMIMRTDPTNSPEAGLPLAHLGGRVEGSGRLNLSTLHSAKGREFDVVVLLGMNADILPNYHDRKRDADMRECRRLFYVGVTRARRTLHLMFEKGNHSEFVKEVFKRSKPGAR